jgi:hypothetical protein
MRLPEFENRQDCRSGNASYQNSDGGEKEDSSALLTGLGNGYSKKGDEPPEEIAPGIVARTYFGGLKLRRHKELSANFTRLMRLSACWRLT